MQWSQLWLPEDDIDLKHALQVHFKWLRLELQDMGLHSKQVHTGPQQLVYQAMQVI